MAVNIKAMAFWDVIAMEFGRHVLFVLWGSDGDV